MSKVEGSTDKEDVSFDEMEFSPTGVFDGERILGLVLSIYVKLLRVWEKN